MIHVMLTTPDAGEERRQLRWKDVGRSQMHRLEVERQTLMQPEVGRRKLLLPVAIPTRGEALVAVAASEKCWCNPKRDRCQ